MSIGSWKREFYKTPTRKATKKNAVTLSLMKWAGLLDENLRKHGVTWDELDVAGFTTSETCALCEAYSDDCAECPLGKRGSACDSNRSPWRTALKYGVATPMVNALVKLLAETPPTKKRKGDEP